VINWDNGEAVTFFFYSSHLVSSFAISVLYGFFFL